MAKKNGFFKSKWAKVILGAFGAIGATGLVTQFTGINNTFIAPALGFLIGGVPVAIAALVLPMLTGQGGGGLSMLGLGAPNQKTTQVGTLYT